MEETAGTPITNAPEIIYLQDGGEDEPLRREFYDDQVTWCADSIADNDTKYIRFDVHEREVAALTTQRDAAVAVLEGLEFQAIPLLLTKPSSMCRILGATSKAIVTEWQERARTAEAQRDELQKRIGYTAVPLVAGGATTTASGTPMTDAEARMMCSYCDPWESHHGYYVLAEFARGLEREVARLSLPPDETMSAHPGCVYCMEKGTPIRLGMVCPKCGDRLPTKREYEAQGLRAELDQARENLEISNEALIQQIRALAAAEAELDAAKRALAEMRKLITDCQDDLATWIVPDSGISDHQVLNTLLGRLDGPQSRAALAAKSTEHGGL